MTTVPAIWAAKFRLFRETLFAKPVGVICVKRGFTLEYWMDEGWFVGRLKEAPGVFSQGETMDELVHNIDEVYHLMLGNCTVARSG